MRHEMNLLQSQADFEKEINRRRRRTILIILSLIVLIVVVTIVEAVLLKKQSVILLSLINLNIILLLLLLVLIFRNIIKLYFEHRAQQLGSKFRTKLVVVFVAMALFPTSLLFLVATNIIAETLDNWLNPQTELFFKQISELGDFSTPLLQQIVFSHTIVIESLLSDAIESGHVQETLDFIREKLQLEFIQLFAPDNEMLFESCVSALDLSTTHFPANVSISSKSPLENNFMNITLNGKKITFTAVAIPEISMIRSVGIDHLVLGFHTWESLDTLQRANNEYKHFRTTERSVFETKGLHITILGMITLTILFSATWLGFYIAKGITIPIERLAEATKAVSSGDLNVLVDVKGYDEVGILIASFNQMTADLRHNRDLIEKAHNELKETNLELTRKKADIEAILQNISTGIIAIDKSGVITSINNAALRMLETPMETALAKHFLAAFAGDKFEPLLSLINQIHLSKSHILHKNIIIGDLDRTTYLTISSTSLKWQEAIYDDIIIIMEDITELLQIQRITAWQEVARRIAHEIKNPLTPIRLSAERLQKRLKNLPETDAQLLNHLTQTIINEVEELKNLVNEFSHFARMPTASLKSGNIHKTLTDIMAVFSQTHEHIEFETTFDDQTPLMYFDFEQIKRAFINLFENAYEAMDGQGIIQINSQFDHKTQFLTIEISDQGKGVPIEDFDKLFLPYYSTKNRGSGLGLAIVRRIITDHRGYIRIKKNQPRGTKFILELPLILDEFELFRVERGNE